MNSIKVKLSGENGNAFNLIGKVSKALKMNGMNEEAQKFQDQALACGSYDELLQLIMKTVDVY